MQIHMLISFIADDRPGLVKSLSEVVNAHQGNWLESRMAKLSGKFAGVVRVAVPEVRAGEFDDALQSLGNEGLTLRLETCPDTPVAADLVPYRLEILGHDRPGIVHEFSAALARRHINVFDLRSDITSAAMSADPLFTAVASFHAPADLDIDELRDQLEAIADELLLEYTLSAL
ncbi:MAG: ACT domain-containing protein [Gammaproteobacteria bacterium]|nr:ACT domain-containing protein [Gammaproteobacteria bacterium]